VKFGRAVPCDLCPEPAAVQIIIVVFDGPSPADQFLCLLHAPLPLGTAPYRTDASASS
jgi:hypothetical protein